MRRTLAIPIGLVAASIAAGALISGGDSPGPTTVVTEAMLSASTLPSSPATSAAGAINDITTTTAIDASSTSAPTSSTSTTAAPTTTVALRPPAAVRVVLANAAGRPGLAARNETPLAAKGYSQIETTDATEKVDTSSVSFAAGFDQEAADVATALGITAAPQPVGVDLPLPATVTTSADVFVILGRDRP